MKIYEVKHDCVTLSLHGNELWQMHQMLLTIINHEKLEKDGIARDAFSLDSNIMAIVELMGKIEKDTQ